MRYLMHSVTTLFNRLNLNDVIKLKKSNIGSMIHQFGLCNTIMTDNDVVEFSNLLKMENPIKFAKEVNEKYDCVVFSLGDFFRKDVLIKNRFANVNLFLKNLKIKTLVVGIGCQRRYWESEEKFINTNNMGELIKEFISENLKHTNIIGVRGYDTANILNKLGFVENKDYFVCGCPSLFLNGAELKIPNEIKKIDKNSKIAITRNFNVNWAFSNSFLFFYNNISKYNNSNTIFTWFYEALNCHYKTDNWGSGKVKLNFNDYILLKYKYCFNIYEYFNLLNNYDFCIGERIHGCAAAIAMGIPTIVICVDYRMEEMCEYHKIPYITIKDISMDVDFKDIFDSANFKLMKDSHIKNFKKYLEFFRINNIHTVFDCDNYNKNTLFKKNISIIND